MRYLAKQNRYTTLQAEALHARGERGLDAARWWARRWCASSASTCCARASSTASRDSCISRIGCFNSFCKYAKLRALEQAGRAR